MFRDTNFLFVDFVELGKNSKTRFTVVRCLSCGQTKKLLNNPDYCLWVDRPEAQMEQQRQPGDEPQPDALQQPHRGCCLTHTGLIVLCTEAST